MTVRRLSQTIPAIPQTPVRRATWPRPMFRPRRRRLWAQLEPPVQVPLVVEQEKHLVCGVRVGQTGLRGRRGRAGIVGTRGDRDAVLGEHRTDLLDPKAHPVGVDMIDDQVNRRSSSAAEKNADAVLRSSFARRNSAFSRLSRLTSADSTDACTGEAPD